ncbi:MAG: pitrilysin family protein [Pseudomonadota bacterium]|nr:pitrilysin family protein [Pseudomonadota bacterium]
MGEVRTLANGMRIFLDPMPGLETAAVGVWAQAGAIDEAPEENGVAHLLEHMAFKGTERRSARAIAEEIEAVGGYLNAATGYQRTGYYARILKDDVTLAFDILADILTDPLFDPADLAKEQEVVVQEIGEANDAPDDAVAELLQTLAFREQSLGRPILGDVESVRGHTPSRLRAFVGRLYRPQQLIVAAAGAIDPDKIEELALAYFGARAPTGEEQSRPKPIYVGGAKHDGRDIEQTHISLAFPAVSARDADYFATRVFAEALGGGMSSRLFQKIREDRGLAYSVYAYADCYDETGVIGAYVGTDEENARDCVRMIREELTSSASDMTDAEIDRARALLRSNMLMSLESPHNRIETAAAQIFTYGDLVPTAHLLQRLESVTVEDVRRCAERALTAGPASLAVVGPAEFAALSGELRA